MQDKIPSLYSLEKPTDVQQLVRQDRYDDCLSCRIVGTAALFGLAGYGYVTGMSQLEKQRAVMERSRSVFGMRSRQVGVVGISLGLVWMGLWRAFR
ncbi:exosome complex exonuclease [Ophiocordyceps camponoti-floridani]|uniref:Exosome complex exonuclease n=1 Tax=Ophiocordyceps camponoti-floridani TaxID=2030778 RepID=A0A8H4QA41_9HYPO|nr:exosome complex exonuclease [Ophiocordyceps camponoti-floridani]